MGNSLPPLVVANAQKAVSVLLAYEFYAQAANSPATKAQMFAICVKQASTAVLQA
jgi:hypothetical protein